MITPKDVHAVAREHGFWDRDRNFGEALMLVVSELGEAIEAKRHGNEAHVAEELADAVIRIFDLAEGFGYYLEQAMTRKHEVNKMRPYLHGKRF